jgi:hypothetical protein
MLTFTDVIGGLGFVLAVDNCARGCLHCPAYGSRALVQRAPLHQLARALADLATAYRRLGTRPPGRVVHCWRISDPLDYTVRLRSGTVATCADVARLWRDHLDQGLYLVTNGAEGRPQARWALAHIAAQPDLVSQVKLTITPADRAWGTERYESDLAADVVTLAPLWHLPSTRIEDPHGRRLRLNVKTSHTQQAETLAVVRKVLRLAGHSPGQADAACADATRVRVKPIYDLGTATGAPSPAPGAVDVRDTGGHRFKPTPQARRRIQYGIRPDLRLFEVDMYAFTERDLIGGDGLPLRWPLGELGTVDLDTPVEKVENR